jgi:hypothetical protein
METSTPSRVDQVISDLELLKIKIASVTARYNILKEDYSRLCEDAIASIIQSSGASEDEKTVAIEPVKPVEDASDIPVKAAVPIQEIQFVTGVPPPVEDIPQSPAAAAAPTPETADAFLAGCPSGDTVVPLSENRASTGKTGEPVPAQVKSVEGLEIRKSRTPSLEEIIAFQQSQLNIKPSQKRVSGKKVNAQTVVDIIGDGIENGLDKLGNGLMFPFARIADLSHKRSPADTSSPKH